MSYREVLGVLENLGLSKGETKVYLALLERGQGTAGDIVKEAAVSRSKVYEMLDRLLARGLVSYVIQKGFKHFEAADPTEIVSYIQKKKDQLRENEEAIKKAIPELQARKNLKSPRQTATIFEGIAGIKTIFNEIITSLKRGERYDAIAVDTNIFYDKEFSVFIKNFHSRRLERGIHVRLLTHKRFQQGVRKLRDSTRLMEVRLFSNALPTATILYKDCVATYVWSQPPIAIVMRSPAISARYRAFFNEVWKSAVPLPNNRRNAFKYGYHRYLYD